MAANKYVKLLDKHNIKAGVLRELLIREKYKAAQISIGDKIGQLNEQIFALNEMHTKLDKEG